MTPVPLYISSCGLLVKRDIFSFPGHQRVAGAVGDAAAGGLSGGLDCGEQKGRLMGRGRGELVGKVAGHQEAVFHFFDEGRALLRETRLVFEGPLNELIDDVAHMQGEYALSGSGIYCPKEGVLGFGGGE